MQTLWKNPIELRPVWPGLTVIVVAMFFGAPIFAVLGGAAVLLFMSDAVPIGAVVEAAALGALYALVVQCFIHRDLWSNGYSSSISSGRTPGAGC